MPNAPTINSATSGGAAGLDHAVLTFTQAPWYGEAINARVRAINSVTGTDETVGGASSGVLPANTATTDYLIKGTTDSKYVAYPHLTSVIPRAGSWKFTVALVRGRPRAACGGGLTSLSPLCQTLK